MVGGQRHAPNVLPPGRRPGTHCTGGWVGPTASLDIIIIIIIVIIVIIIIIIIIIIIVNSLFT